jgi:hypothetical protein
MKQAKIFIVFGLLLILSSAAGDAFSQELPVNQRKIEREREKKRRQAQKEYQQAVNRHKKMQSPQTKSSMKKNKKEARKNTPIRH